MATHNSSGSNLEHGLDDSREVDMDGSDTSGGGSDGKGNITFPIIKVKLRVIDSKPNIRYRASSNLISSQYNKIMFFRNQKAVKESKPHYLKSSKRIGNCKLLIANHSPITILPCIGK